MNKVEIVVVAHNKTASTFREVKRDARNAGVGAGAALSEGLASSLKDFKLPAISAGGGLVAGFAGMLAAALPAAFAAASVTAAMAGGVALAARSSAVQNSAKSAGREIMSSLTEAASSFVGPTLKSVDIIREKFGKLKPVLKDIFDSSSSQLPKLISGLADALTSITKGVSNLIKGAGAPAMSGLVTGVKVVARAIKNVFDDFADNGAESAVALLAVFSTLAGAILIVGKTAEVAAVSVGFLAKIGSLGPGASAAYEGFRQELKASKDAADDAADGISKIGEAADDSVQSLQDLTDQLRAQYDPSFALLEAQDKLHESMRKYHDAQKKYGDDDSRTQKYLDDATRATLDMGDAAAKAAGTFDGTLSPAMEALLRDAGYTDEMIASVKNRLAEADAQATKTASGLIYTAQEARSLADAVREASGALAALHSKQIDINIAVNTKYYGRPFSSSGATGIGGTNYTGHAAGGVTGAAGGGGRGGMTWVGEQGPELVRLPFGSNVLSSPDSGKALRDLYRRAVRGASGKGSGVFEDFSIAGMSSNTRSHSDEISDLFYSEHPGYDYRGGKQSQRDIASWLAQKIRQEGHREASTGGGRDVTRSRTSGTADAVRFGGTTGSAGAQWMMAELRAGNITIPQQYVR